MKVQVFTANPIQQNGLVVFNEQKDAVIIDPACYENFEKQALLDFIHENQLHVHAVLNTHCHIDHVMGNAFCVDHFKVPLLAHKEELFTLSFAERSAKMYGLDKYVPSPEPTQFIEDNQVLTFGSLVFHVIFGPGHSIGHVAFYAKESNKLFGGDILFKGSFGRVDLPGGSIDILKDTIFNRFFTLPDDTILYPGLGPTTTIGEEKISNYILNF